MIEQEVTGTCTNLSRDEIVRLLALMSSVADAFDRGDAEGLQALSHAGADPKGAQNSLEFTRLLMRSGNKVARWEAAPYKEPDWEIMRLLRHHPLPAIAVNVTLRSARGAYPLYIACSPDAQGNLRTCYYRDRYPA